MAKYLGNYENIHDVASKKDLENYSKEVQVIIGDGSTTMFNLPHSLGTSELVVSVQDTDTNEIVFTSVIVNEDNVLIEFDPVYTPANGKRYKVIMISGATLGEVPEDLVVTYTYDHSQLNNRNVAGAHNASAIDGLFDAIYPIGSIYMSVNSVNPKILFGGTWEQLKDRFLLGAGDTYVAGSTGGEAIHTLTTDEMPLHHHMNRYNWNVGTTNILSVNGAPVEAINNVQGLGSIDTGGATGGIGGSQPHNNMPPYLTVYMWKRTA